MKETIFISSPIFYVNSKPHIGAAHTMVMCDFLKRFHEKILNANVFFSTGTDEHGHKIYQKSIETQQDINIFVSERRQYFINLAKELKIDYDIFINTTSEVHKKTVLEIWNKLKNNGDIYEGIYSGYYSKSDETFFSETELINGFAPTGAEVQWISEECYFLKLSRVEKQLLDFYDKNPDFTFPQNRIHELKSFIKHGLKDLCISRKGKWGINLDKETVIYVWFEALINYLTVCNYPILNYWHNVFHVIGKDILVFHGVYWPAILLLLNIELPKKIIVHNWWIANEKKMSKSLGNIVDPFELINKYGYLAVKCCFLAENLIINDGNFDEEKILSYYNDFFVSKFCNLIHRVFFLGKKNNISSLNIKHNEYYENLLKISGLDSANYWKYFFSWCDNLNKKVDEEKIWDNNDKIIDIMEEINCLIFYGTVLFDLPILSEIHENSKIFFRK